jgi:catechol-2,3-dioxygenase
VYVADRGAAESWYKRVLGLTRTKEYEFWAVDGGPLTIQNSEGTVHIALFERNPMKTRSTIALGVSAVEYMEWKRHLVQELDEPPASEDHELSLSLYFKEPDGNPYDITTYEHEAVRWALAASAA